MKLRRGDSRIIYLDDEGHEVEREDMLVQVQGKSISEGKAIVADHEKTTLWEWTDREGRTVARSYGSEVVGIEIKPADADARRADYLRRLREAQQRVASPDATPQDMADAMALQIEYMEFLSLLDD